MILGQANDAGGSSTSLTATIAGGTPAFEERREPASISKLITTAAALRAGLDPDAAISQMTCTGSHRYEGGTLWCSHPSSRSLLSFDFWAVFTSDWPNSFCAPWLRHGRGE